MRPKITKIASQQNKTIKACAYVRVSTDKVEQEESYYYQKQYWEKRLNTISNLVCVGVYGDEGKSGRTIKKRPQFLEMINQAKLGNIDAIYTKSFTRFGRNVNETISIIRELRDIGVAVIFENDNINSMNLTDELLLKVKAIFSEVYLKTTKENVTWSARKRYSQGIVELNNFILGYDVKKGKLTINEEQAKIVREIFSLYVQGLGTSAISKHLTEKGYITVTGQRFWNHSTIIGMLQNEKYIGDVLIQKTYRDEQSKRRINNGEVEKYYIENDHEPIIDRETFEKVQQIIASRRPSNTEKSHNRYEFSGLIWCEHCGKSYKRKVNNSIKNFSNVCWACSLKDRYGIDYCDSQTISDDLLKAITLDAYNEYIKTPNNTEKSIKLLADIEALNEQLNKLRLMLQGGYINYAKYNKQQIGVKEKILVLDKQLREQQGFAFYKKQGKPLKEYEPSIVEKHIKKIYKNKWQIKFIFNNNQEIIKEYKYEHRKYCKNY